MMIEKILFRARFLLAFAPFLILGFLPQLVTASSPSIDVWWPTSSAELQGVQPFKAMIPNLDVSQYEMFWQVDGGQWNWMDTNYTDYQHKEAEVDVTNWMWHGSGPYTVNFIAEQNGSVIAQQQETIYVHNGLPTTPLPAVAAPLQPTTAAPTPLYVSNPEASQQEALWASSSTDAAAMQLLASQPTATWFGNWNSNVEQDVQTLVAAAAASSSVPVMVAYNIPERDCGGFSSDGTDNPAGYSAWIQAFAEGLGSNPAIVILEPDALAQISCLSSADQATRMQLLSSAVTTLKGDPNAKVYIDAGHSDWIDPTTMAHELTEANIAQADGFSLNVSNFMSTSNEITYGDELSAQTGNKHFVIDTSRNGNGSDGQWCNPPDMAIGQKPTLQTGNSLVDAFLWIKTPGESDGTCNGGPTAGVWWPSYALGLVEN